MSEATIIAVGTTAYTLVTGLAALAWKQQARANEASNERVESAVGTLTESVDAMKETVVKIETTVFGANGTNGLNGEQKQLRRVVHRHGNAITNLLARVGMLDKQGWRDGGDGEGGA